MTAITTALAAPPAFALVPFREHEILAARVGNEVRVPMKAFCGTLGLPWEPQRKRIQRDPVLREGASMMEVPSAGGTQRQLALPLELLVGFLFTADAERYAPELRDRVDLFRRECFAALHAHFFPARPTSTPVIARGPAPADLAIARRSAATLIVAIAAETRAPVRRTLYQLLARDAELIGLEVPRLEQIGFEGDPPPLLVARLVAGLEVLSARRVRWNHLGKRANGRMAFVLPEIARLFARHDIDVQVDDALRAALRAGNSSWRVVVRTIPSLIARAPVLATILSPWPVQHG